MPARAQTAGTANQGPLAGLHIVDVSTYVAGPSGMMTLAQLGADVIRVDPVGGATDTRRLPLDEHGTSLYWVGLNKAKRSIEVDLRSGEGQDIVRRLLSVPGAGHGILVTNAVGQDWLRYEPLRTVRPDLIQVHILGRSDGRPAVDYTVNSEVGLPWLTGPVDFDRPVNHVLPAWDLLTGLHAALAVLAAEHVRRQGGTGQLVELYLSDVAASVMGHLGFVADVAVNGSRRLRDGNYLYGSYGCDFATSDGRRVMVVALTSRHWRNLVKLSGIGEAITALERTLGVDFSDEEVRYRYRDVASALLTPWFAERDHDEVATALDRSQVLWGDFRSVEEFVTSPDALLAKSDLFADVHQPGVGTFPVPRPVARMSGWTDPAPAPAPRVGEDTATVLTEWLGCNADELNDLHGRRIIGGNPPTM